MKKYVLPLFLILLAGCAEEEASGPVYDTAGVERRTIEVAVSSAGIVEPLATVEVKSKASGEVLDLLVEIGDKVQEGTLMVAIDPRTVRNRLDQSDAELKAALSRREIALTQKARVESLVKAGTLTQSDLEQAMLDVVASLPDRHFYTAVIAFAKSDDARVVKLLTRRAATVEDPNVKRVVDQIIADLRDKAR